MLDSIADSVDMNLSKLQKTVKDREAWCAAVHEVKVRHDLVTEQQQKYIYMYIFIHRFQHTHKHTHTHLSIYLYFGLFHSLLFFILILASVYIPVSLF